MNDLVYIVIGAALGLAVPWAIVLLFKALTLSVEDHEAVLVTSFGKLVRTLDKPGLYSLPSKIFPWVSTRRVSLQRDFRTFEKIHVNDARGTTVIIDLWLELRVVDPARALFSIADWDQSLQNLVTHAAISILGDRDFQQILGDRIELCELLRRDVAAETARWGVEIDLLFIKNVSLLPEVSRLVFESVAARLERAKADVEAEGHLRVAMLEADTSVRVARLVAEAKGQYPAAIGRAFSTLAPSPRVLAAYNELYELAQLRPHRMVAFQGFNGDLRAVDAAMLVPSLPDGSHSQTPSS